MRTRLSRLISLIAFAGLTAGCATSNPPPAPPPRLSIPEAASKPCLLDLLPENATQADLEAVYNARGAAVLNCDGARQLALETLLAERRLVDAWIELQQPKRRGWRPF